MKNNKGFTLVELLITIAILGIISGMTIPVINNVSIQMEQKKFNSYGDSLITGAKLYRNSYEEDLFGHHDSGCALISYNELKEKKLIKDFPDKNISCDNENTLVRIVKMKNQYGYSYQLYCGEQNGGSVTNVRLRSSSLSRKVEETLDNNAEHDADNDGFNDDTCNLSSTISISADPEKSLEKKESHTTSVKVTSMTGILLGSGIDYAWIEADNAEGTTSTDFNTITNWKKWTFELAGKEKQKDEIIKGKSIDISKNFTTPNKAPAFYLLVLKNINIKDLSGNAWQEAGNNTNYKVFGVYNVAQKYTLTYDSQGGSKCDDKSIMHEKNGTEKWGNLCTPTKKGVPFDGWYTEKNGGGTKIDSNTVATSDLKVYAKWKINQVKIKLKANGGSLAEQHGAAYTLNNDSILKNGNEIIHSINYGESLGSSGLLNWNNTTALNLIKDGYTVKSGAEWICEEGCKNANQIFSQSGAIAASEFCDAKNKDCTVTLKVNWTGYQIATRLSKYISENSANYPKINNSTSAIAPGGSTVNFTIPAINDFVYKGARIRNKSNGSVYATLDANARSFTMPNYDIYLDPIYRKNDNQYLQWLRGNTDINKLYHDASETGGWCSTGCKYDVTRPYFTWATDNQYFSIQVKNPNNAFDNTTIIEWARAQTRTQSPIPNFHQYCRIEMATQGESWNYSSDARRTFRFGALTSSKKDKWLHEASGASQYDSGEIDAYVKNPEWQYYSLDLSPSKSINHEYYLVFEYFTHNTCSSINLYGLKLVGCEFDAGNG